MGRFRYLTGWLLCAGVFGSVVLLAAPAGAAQLTDADARGGGLVMGTGEEPSNPPYFGWTEPDIGIWTATAATSFSKVESAGHETGDSGSSGTGGSGCAGGSGGGGCSGNCGNSDHGGPGSGGSGGHLTDTTGGHTTGSHDHVELFDRLAPIHLFLTLENTGNDGLDFYLFTATVENQTDQNWDGFLFALKRNEGGLAKFTGTEQSATHGFSLSHQGGKKLEWSGGQLKPGQAAAFTFGVNFLDCSDADGAAFPCSDSVHGETGGYQVMLQQFALVAKPVPEPGSALLLGSGLLVLSGTLGRRR